MNFFRSPDNKPGGGNNQTEKIKNFDKWVFPFYKNEEEAIEKFSVYLKKEFDIKYDEYTIEKSIINSIDDGEEEYLSDDIWSKLENSRSYSLQEGDMEKAKQLVLEHHKNTKGLESVKERMEKNKSIDMPAIVNFRDRYFLIWGETRLIDARIFGNKIKVLNCKLEI